ncbi:hypothetical protein KMAR_30650 [Kluyveromyces marxianus]|nr:hypothetical protein KMAR_30650 [Kluyveromyces marxianus]
MDPYSLKSENRKKFQDKEKLKRKHATPSDRKYRTLNKQTCTEKQPQQEPVAKPLESNEHRYTNELIGEDVELNDEQTVELAARMKQILLEKGNEKPFLKSSNPVNTDGVYTKKKLSQMSIEELNQVILKRNSIPDSVIKTGPEDDEKPIVKVEAQSMDKHKTKTTNPSHIPTQLKDDEDFLDSII